MANNEETQFFTRGTAAFLYEEPIKDLIMQLKYDANALVAAAVAPYMAAAILKEISQTPEKVVLIPVPLCEKRQKQRGYNQAELLANEIGKYLDLSVDTKILKRTKATQIQKGMNLKQRAENLRDAFCVSNPEFANGNKYIIVDDVFTTGATVNECARALKNAGATQIDAIVCARIWRD
jgi:ComF family protein